MESTLEFQSLIGEEEEFESIPYSSILFPSAIGGLKTDDITPDYFVDLNLDQIVASITAGKEGYDLKPFFHVPLQRVDDILFRHAIMHDLGDARFLARINAFADGMRAMRDSLEQAKKAYYQRQKERWFLDAVVTYCHAITCLADDMSQANLTSAGLLAFGEYLTQYAASRPFTSLLEQSTAMMAALGSVHYCVKINGLTVQVTKHEGEPDYSAEVEATFARFKQGAAKSYTFDFLDSLDMNHVEAQILEQLAQLYAEEFSRLETFAEANRDFLNPDVVTFDREIQFYVTYLEHIARLKNAGLGFCFPRITQDKEVWNHGGFDLALADKLLGEHTKPVCNDFHLQGQERIVVVSGPNQGGKTTFARMFGQLHYLASLGCPVPGQDAQLFLFDKLFTHFEREENAQNLRGKLQDDLERVHDILDRATTESIIIMNEIFTSTTLQDAIALSKSIAAKIIQLDLLCVWVTFVDELASFAAQTVSMVSTVDPGDLAERTYKIVRKEADGRSYAMSIAEKYRLTYDMLRDRLTV